MSLDARSDEYLDLPAPLATTERKTYVLDTSVLLADPGALFRFVEHEVVIPLVVISELEALRDQSNDHRILSVAKTLADEGFDTVVVTKDLPLRLKAAAVGIPADEYRSELAAPNEWPGIATVDPAPSELIDALYEGARVDSEEVGHELLTHTSVILRSGSQSAIARVLPNKTLRLIHPPTAFGLRARWAEQQIALDLLLDDDIGIVSLGGRAGCGKTVLALAAALDLTIEQSRFHKILVFRPLFAVGGQDLGYLPGSEAEKMSPWAAGITEVLPLTHDVAQRDNLRVGRDDGIATIVSRLKGHSLFAHVSLTRSERSPIAEVAGQLLDEF